MKKDYTKKRERLRTVREQLAKARKDHNELIRHLRNEASFDELWEHKDDDYDYIRCIVASQHPNCWVLHEDRDELVREAVARRQVDIDRPLYMANDPDRSVRGVALQRLHDMLTTRRQGVEEGWAYVLPDGHTLVASGESCDRNLVGVLLFKEKGKDRAPADEGMRVKVRRTTAVRVEIVPEPRLVTKEDQL